MAAWPLSFNTYNPLVPSPPKKFLIIQSNQKLWDYAEEHLELYIRAHIAIETINYYLSISFHITNGTLTTHSIMSYREAATYTWIQSLGDISPKSWGKDMHQYSQDMFKAQRNYESAIATLKARLKSSIIDRKLDSLWSTLSWNCFGDILILDKPSQRIKFLDLYQPQIKGSNDNDWPKEITDCMYNDCYPILV